MQSLKEEANRGDLDGPDGEVEIDAHAESKAVGDYENSSDGDIIARIGAQ